MKTKFITWKFQVDDTIPDPQMRQIMQRWMEEGQREYLPKEVRFDGFEVHPDGFNPEVKVISDVTISPEKIAEFRKEWEAEYQSKNAGGDVAVLQSKAKALEMQRDQEKKRADELQARVAQLIADMGAAQK